MVDQVAFLLPDVFFTRGSFLPGNIPMNEIPLISYYLYSLYDGDIETSLKQEQSYFLCFPENRRNI
jgi:hypothetical protein